MSETPTPVSTDATDPAPAPGPDTATWTIDDYGDPVFRGLDFNDHFRWDKAMSGDAYDALVAVVRAARVHESCGPAADTLRQARELAENVDETAVSRDWVLGTYGAAQTFFTLGDLLDLLADGGTDG